MIEVFKTNVSSKEEARLIITLLANRFGYQDAAFDLEDCDRILRINASTIFPECVIGLLKNANIDCEVLPD